MTKVGTRLRWLIGNENFIDEKTIIKKIKKYIKKYIIAKKSICKVGYT